MINKSSELFKQRAITEHLKILPANSLKFNELYDHYYKVDFLYPAKLKRLNNHKNLIKANWEKGWAAGREILWTLVYKETRLNKMGTITSWRSTNSGWVQQHMTSEPKNPKGPLGVFSMLLSAQEEGILREYKSGQNCYRPENKYSSKIFGRMVNTVGADAASSALFDYLEVDPRKIRVNNKSIKIVRCGNNNHYGIGELAQKLRGSIYCDAEDLKEYDIELEAVDELYRKYGLRRKRFIWIAFSNGKSEPLGAAIAYRGPFGFNFSFLENRCDLLVERGLNDELRRDVCEALLQNAATAYFDSELDIEYPLKYIVVIAEKTSTDALKNIVEQQNREYYQSIWLRSGFEKWRGQMEKVYERVSKRWM